MVAVEHTTAALTIAAQKYGFGIFPHNPWLAKKYRAHINVEVWIIRVGILLVLSDPNQSSRPVRRKRFIVNLHRTTNARRMHC